MGPSNASNIIISDLHWGVLLAQGLLKGFFNGKMIIVSTMRLARKYKNLANPVTNTSLVKEHWNSHGWCGSVGWMSSHKPKCYQFDSQWGPGLRVWSWLGCIWKATNRCFSLTWIFTSLSFSLPPCLSKSKQTNKQTNPEIQDCLSGAREMLYSLVTKGGIWKGNISMFWQLAEFMGS